MSNRSLIFGGAAIQGFMDGMTQIMEFRDRQQYRAMQMERVEQQRKEQKRVEQQLRKQQQQRQAAFESFVAARLKKMEPGQEVPESWRAVLNHAYDGMPDTKKIVRTDSGLEIQTAEPVKFQDGRESTTFEISNEQLEDMFNMQFSRLDVTGLKILENTQRAYSKLTDEPEEDAISPTQRAVAISNMIDLRRRLASEMEQNMDFEEAERLWAEIEELDQMYQDLMGIHPGAAEGEYTPAQKNALDKYNGVYEEFSSGGGFWDFNLQGISGKEETRLDELWRLTGQPMRAAPHRAGQNKDSDTELAEQPAAQGEDVRRSGAGSAAKARAAVPSRPHPGRSGEGNYAPERRPPGGDMLSVKLPTGQSLRVPRAGVSAIELPDGRRMQVDNQYLQESLQHGARLIEQD